MSNRIEIVCETVFGRTSKVFYTIEAALVWMKTCAENQVEFSVSYI